MIAHAGNQGTTVVIKRVRGKKFCVKLQETSPFDVVSLHSLTSCIASTSLQTPIAWEVHRNRPHW